MELVFDTIFMSWDMVFQDRKVYLKIMRHNSILCAAAIAALFCLPINAKSPKYVFMFIGDGMSTPQRMVSDEFSRKIGRGPLAMNMLPCQCMTRTKAANSLVTDSAAAATAIACGERANMGALGVTPDGKRIESVAEIARDKGMKVGIVTTVTIVHATPAGFYAHLRSRSDFYKIALELIDSRFDFFAGGGVYDKYDDKKNSRYKGNVFDLAAKSGYNVVKTKAGFDALKPGCGRTWCVFGDESMDFVIDSPKDVPTLADMVAKSIELLDNPNGFFIMGEGGKLDYGAHANDPATVVRETVAMDDAVKVALEFAKKHPEETLIITTGDHETGGMTMGFGGTGAKFRIELLAYQKCSTDAFSNMIADKIRANPKITFNDVKADVTAKFGLIFDKAAATDRDKRHLLLNAAEIDILKKAFKTDVGMVLSNAVETRAHDAARRRKFAAAARRLLSNHAGIGWTTGSHTAMPTMTTSQGCGAENFVGIMNNSDIALKLKALLK